MEDRMMQRLGVLVGMVMFALPFGPAHAQPADKLQTMSWNQVLDAAAGGEVNWFMWGGSDAINRYVSDWVGTELAERYDITLKRVGINDTVEAVNAVLGEVEAGVTEDGSVDLIWINGENFRSMKQADLLFCGYLQKLPNYELIDPEDPAIAYDFGTPVDGCEVPWNRAQVALGYDSARVEQPPLTMPALLDWIQLHPGRFAYPAPPDFTGSVFVRHVFYHAAGGYERLLVPFDQALYDEVAAATFDILNEIEPFLWREGATYPKDSAALDQLFANQEVDFTISYEPAEIGQKVINGTFPETTSSYALDDGTIGNVNFVAIPVNSPNKAAAMVLANFLISPEAQLEKQKPEVWGASTTLDRAKLSTEWAAAFAGVPRHEAVVTETDLAKRALPELSAEWLTAIEQGWIEHVGR
jgi:putative spermidine/putrescine transport system substrate-binding protein